MSASRCNRCDAPIVWGETAKGRWLAFDTEAVANGPWILLTGTTHALEMDDPKVAAIIGNRPEVLSEVAAHRHRAHATTCDLRGLQRVGDVAASALPHGEPA